MNLPDLARNCLVLVVEDEPIQRSSIMALVEDAGCEVLGAWDAASALEMMADNPGIVMIITDIDMPGEMDGLGLADHVRAESASIDIIVVTAGLKPDVALLPVRSVFMPKPLDLAQLETAVRQLTSG